MGPLRAEPLVLRDAEGELFGVRGQSVDFDAFVHDGRRFLVEVKGFAEPENVVNFHRKMEFAKRHLDEPFEPLLIAPYAWRKAVQRARSTAHAFLEYCMLERGVSSATVDGYGVALRSFAGCFQSEGVDPDRSAPADVDRLMVRGYMAHPVGEKELN